MRSPARQHEAQVASGLKVRTLHGSLGLELRGGSGTTEGMNSLKAVSGGRGDGGSGGGPGRPLRFAPVL